MGELAELPISHPKRICSLTDDVKFELVGFLTSGFPHVCALHSAGTRDRILVNGRTQTPMEGYSGSPLAALCPSEEPQR